METCCSQKEIQMKYCTPLFLLLITITPAYPDENKCPMHAEHSKQQDTHHHSEVDRRGNEVMGFEHEKSAHHFYLRKDGGVVEATVKDPKDSTTLKNIQSHMQEISRLFAEGDFSKPKEIHGVVPPGVETMKERLQHIQFQYEPLKEGASVKITTSDQEALEAIHEFLRFQIQDHRTGDPLEITEG
jgi:hypothetical protein